MTTTQQKQLFKEIEVLSMELKAKLVDKLLYTLNNIDSSVDSVWMEELNKRKIEIQEERVSLVEGNEVFKKIWQRFEFNSIPKQKLSLMKR